jgi:hypothetical protein
MTIDQLIADLDTIKDRAELVAFLAPLRVPASVTNSERARLARAVIKTAARCWANRII